MFQHQPSDDQRFVVSALVDGEWINTEPIPLVQADALVAVLEDAGYHVHSTPASQMAVA